MNNGDRLLAGDGVSGTVSSSKAQHRRVTNAITRRFFGKLKEMIAGMKGGCAAKVERRRLAAQVSPTLNPSLCDLYDGNC